MADFNLHEIPRGFRVCEPFVCARGGAAVAEEEPRGCVCIDPVAFSFHNFCISPPNKHAGCVSLAVSLPPFALNLSPFNLLHLEESHKRAARSAALQTRPHLNRSVRFFCLGMVLGCLVGWFSFPLCTLLVSGPACLPLVFIPTRSQLDQQAMWAASAEL